MSQQDYKFENLPRIDRKYGTRYILVVSLDHRLLFIDEMGVRTIMSDTSQHIRHMHNDDIRLAHYFGKYK